MLRRVETGREESRWSSNEERLALEEMEGSMNAQVSEATAESDHVQLTSGHRQKHLCPSTSQCVCPEDLLGAGTVLSMGVHQWQETKLSTLMQLTLQGSQR